MYTSLLLIYNDEGWFVGKGGRKLTIKLSSVVCIVKWRMEVKFEDMDEVSECRKIFKTLESTRVKLIDQILIHYQFVSNITEGENKEGRRNVKDNNGKENR